MRERLIELLKHNSQCEDKDCKECKLNGSCLVNREADHLIANGVIVLPCKVGDTVYYHGGIHKSLIKSAVVEEIIINSCGVGDLLVTSENGVTFENAIGIFYFTKEEAEAALKGGADK